LSHLESSKPDREFWMTVVEEGETKGTTEAGCQTETGVMRVALKAS